MALVYQDYKPEYKPAMAFIMFVLKPSIFLTKMGVSCSMVSKGEQKLDVPL